MNCNAEKSFTAKPLRTPRKTFNFARFAFFAVKKIKPPDGGFACAPAQTRTALFGSGGRHSVH